MKNKKLVYILLPLVIIIWGMVIYRIFFENRKRPENLTSRARPALTSTEKTESKRYKLIANYKDPFLKNMEVVKADAEEEKNEESNNLENLRRRRTSVSRVRWPEITYGGYINGNKNETTILLKVQNRDYLCNTGDTIANILIKGFYGDSILVLYNDEEKILKK